MAGPADTPHKARPLSPHLQIYKPQMTSMLSILHRATGAALAIGLLLVAAVLIAAAMGEESYNMVMSFVSSPVGLLMLLGWTFALFYHMCNGVRHLIWDCGYLFEIKNATRAGYVVLVISLLLTAAVWLLF